MAYYRKKICASAGCKNYAESNSAYCSEHKKEIFRGTTSKYEWLYKLPRWAHDRKDFLLKPENFYCIECKSPSQLPHHSHGFCDYDSFFDKRWWVPMCKSCHSRLHTKVTNEELYNLHYNGS